MDVFWIYTALTLAGLCLGSYAGATVWRLRARQLVEDKKLGEKVNAKEYKRLTALTKKRGAHDRSQCLSCHHQLAWYDLVPLVSWVALRGRCRYCRTRIGVLEPLIELAVAAFFVGSYILWPVPLHDALTISQFVLWLVSGVGLAILFVYDLRWFLLPDVVMFPTIALSAAYAILGGFGQPDILAYGMNVLGSVVILSGVYFIVYHLSRGEWIGFGDVKLGLALALLLGDWQLAFLALFAANLIGCLIVIPGLLMKKIGRKTHVPFGPLLMAGFVVAVFAGEYIISWYTGGLFL